MKHFGIKPFIVNYNAHYFPVPDHDTRILSNVPTDQDKKAYLCFGYISKTTRRLVSRRNYQLSQLQ